MFGVNFSMPCSTNMQIYPLVNNPKTFLIQSRGSHLLLRVEGPRLSNISLMETKGP